MLGGGDAEDDVLFSEMVEDEGPLVSAENAVMVRREKIERWKLMEDRDFGEAMAYCTVANCRYSCSRHGA